MQSEYTSPFTYYFIYYEHYKKEEQLRADFQSFFAWSKLRQIAAFVDAIGSQTAL